MYTEELTKIAQDSLNIQTLETRNSDSLDFHEVATWGLKNAITAAYRLKAQNDPPKWVVDVIAVTYFFRDDLETSNSNKDFFETSVWAVKSALEKAVQYGTSNKFAS